MWRATAIAWCSLQGIVDGIFERELEA